MTAGAPPARGLGLGTMQEVVIPLRKLKKDEQMGSPEDYMRLIQAEHAGKYLEALGIAATPANRAAVMRFRPLDDCGIQGVWDDDGAGAEASAVASAIRVLPPVRDFSREVEEYHDLDMAWVQHWYGKGETIPVGQPSAPQMPGLWPHPKAADEPRGSRGGGGAAGTPPEAALAAGGPGQGAAPQAPPGGAEALKDELERVRLRASARTKAVSPDTPAKDARSARALAQRRELALVKARFLLPFACERNVGGGSRRKEISTWPADGPLDLPLPQDRLAEVLRPISISLGDLHTALVTWVRGRMPLELVTSRRDEKTLQKVRSVCCSSEAGALAGLMAHLTYWLALGHARGEGRTRLTDRALQTLIASAKEAWHTFEEEHRDTPAGVSLVLPCLMLTVKVGMLHCFDTQYPKICQDQDLAQQLIDRINTVAMRLLDRDNVYPRFGRVDCTGEAATIARKVEHFQNPRGCAGASRRFAGGVRALSQPVQNALKNSADAPLPPLGSARG